MKLFRFFASARITHSFHLLASSAVSTGCSWADAERGGTLREVRECTSTDAGGRVCKVRAQPPPYRRACDVCRVACVALYEGLGLRV